jgi:hypothetical protein
MINREDTRIILETEFLQNFKRPERFPGDRISWSTVPRNFFPGNLLQNVFGPLRILPEFFRRKIVYETMVIAVTPYFMSAAVNVFY